LINQIITDFKYRCDIDRPKYLLIDEAHVPLQKKMFTNFLDLISRTGNKSLISFGLFSQSAYEFSNLEFWPALRTACSSFLFFPNSRLNKELYKATYDLTDKEIQTIRTLEPRKEFMLIQPEIGVSKVLRFNPDQMFLDNFTANPTDKIIKEGLYA
jgi:type IV secretory pathway VirB4 component